MQITSDQLQTIQEWADELERLASVDDQMGMPPAYYLRQINKALPDLASRIRAMVVTIERGHWRELVNNRRDPSCD